MFWLALPYEVLYDRKRGRMRPTPIIDPGPFDTVQACLAAGIHPSRLALWHHRSQFMSDEDQREARLPGDPRQYTGRDCLRMRLVAAITDKGVAMRDAQAALRLFDATGYSEPWHLVLIDAGSGEFTPRAVRPADLGKVLNPASVNGPKAAFMVDIRRLADEVSIELGLIHADQMAGRARVMGWTSSDAEVGR